MGNTMSLLSVSGFAFCLLPIETVKLRILAKVYCHTFCHYAFRPLVLIGGGYDQDQTSMGGFQEWPQVSYYYPIPEVVQNH